MGFLWTTGLNSCQINAGITVNPTFQYDYYNEYKKVECELCTTKTWQIGFGFGFTAWKVWDDIKAKMMNPIISFICKTFDYIKPFSSVFE